jgi:hypothetical protein
MEAAANVHAILAPFADLPFSCEMRDGLDDGNSSPYRLGLLHLALYLWTDRRMRGYDVLSCDNLAEELTTVSDTTIRRVYDGMKGTDMVSI